MLQRSNSAVLNQAKTVSAWFLETILLGLFILEAAAEAFS